MLLLSSNASAFFNNREKELQQLKEQLHAVAKKISDINEQIRQKEELIFQLKERVKQRSRVYYAELRMQLRETNNDEKVIDQIIAENIANKRKNIEQIQSGNFKKMFEKHTTEFSKDMCPMYILMPNFAVECMLLYLLFDQLAQHIFELEKLDEKIEEFSKPSGGQK
jgi:hypothetical protein